MHSFYHRLIMIVVLFHSMSASVCAQSSDEAARTYLVRGLAAIEMAKGEEELLAAAEEFKKATEIAPTMAAAWYNLGSVQAKTGQLRDAIASYEHYLTLSPQADDARRIKDEIIKLKYRLERTEKFQALSGLWGDETGGKYELKAAGSKIILKGGHKRSTDDYKVDALVSGISTGGQKHLDWEELTLNLNVTGKSLSGYWEAPAWDTPYMRPCLVPAEKGSVEGNLDDGNNRMVLRLTRAKYRIISSEPLFGGPSCSEVTVLSTRPVEMVFVRQAGTSSPNMPTELQLPPGGIGASLKANASGNLTVIGIMKGSPAEQGGLQIGDEITAVDGFALASLKTLPEKIMKLRGQPGTTVQLTVTRNNEQKIFTFQRVDISNFK